MIPGRAACAAGVRGGNPKAPRSDPEVDPPEVDELLEPAGLTGGDRLIGDRLGEDEGRG